MSTRNSTFKLYHPSRQLRDQHLPSKPSRSRQSQPSCLRRERLGSGRASCLAPIVSKENDQLNRPRLRMRRERYPLTMTKVGSVKASIFSTGFPLKAAISADLPGSSLPVTAPTPQASAAPCGHVPWRVSMRASIAHGSGEGDATCSPR